MKASIDVGSQSVLFIVQDGENTVCQKFRVTALGKDLEETGVLSPEGRKKTLEVLDEYCRDAKKYGIEPENIITAGTQALRVATDRFDFIREIQNRGLDCIVLSAEGEAYYTTLGVLGKNEHNKVLLDMGGASTEIIQSEKFETLSLNVGAVWANNKEFFEIDKKLENYTLQKHPHITAVGGTATALMALIENVKSYEDLKETQYSFRDWEEKTSPFHKWSEKQFLERFPILGKRAAYLSHASFLLNGLLRKLKCEKLEISLKGLRHGLLLVDNISSKYYCR